VAEKREPPVRIRVFLKPESILFLFGTGRAQGTLEALARAPEGPATGPFRLLPRWAAARLPAQQAEKPREKPDL